MPYLRGPLKGQLKIPEMKRLAKAKGLKINYTAIDRVALQTAIKAKGWQVNHAKNKLDKYTAPPKAPAPRPGPPGPPPPPGAKKGPPRGPPPPPPPMPVFKKSGPPVLGKKGAGKGGAKKEKAGGFSMDELLKRAKNKKAFIDPLHQPKFKGSSGIIDFRELQKKAKQKKAFDESNIPVWKKKQTAFEKELLGATGGMLN
mgnify:CR=1 FL=1|tara:strand:- start:250 stop:849 length:600 start_codon:yes stop_codon:yes gene_type:complete